jgi:hypothetical protein
LNTQLQYENYIEELIKSDVIMINHYMKETNNYNFLKELYEIKIDGSYFENKLIYDDFKNNLGTFKELRDTELFSQHIISIHKNTEIRFHSQHMKIAFGEIYKSRNN